MAARTASPRRRAITTVSIGLLIVTVVWLINRRFPTVLQRLELSASDFAIYQQKVAKPTGMVAIADVDERSIAKFGRWPWPRSVEARLIDALKNYRAAVIGLDIVFSEPESQANDTDFARAMTAHKSTFIGYLFGTHLEGTDAETGLAEYKTKLREPLPISYSMVRKSIGPDLGPPVATTYLPSTAQLSRAARGTAYLNIDQDIDGAVRTFPAVIHFDGIYCVPFFLALADAYQGYPPLSLELTSKGVASVSIGQRAIPVDEVGRMILHFRGSAQRIPRYSIADIVDHQVPSAALADKIVVAGVTAPALGDRFATPVGTVFPGVEIQANAIDNVLAGDFIHHSLEDEHREELASWILGSAMSVASALAAPVLSLVMMLILGSGYLWYAAWRLTHDGALIGIVLPWLTLLLTYLGVTSYRYITEGKERRFLRSAFEHYMNRDVVASVLSNPDGLKLVGERRHLSILFADIVGFTSRAERMEPELLASMLNAYTSVMTDVILDTGGVLELIGDGIMAFWGAPIAAQNPARVSLHCALRMLDELNALARRDARFEDLEIGIGVATGDVVVGNRGGERHISYSVTGDTVNLASRLEGLTRYFKVRLLVDRNTFDEAGTGFIGRPIGLVQVQGKNQAVPVVEVVGRDGDAVDESYYRRFAEVLKSERRGGSPVDNLRALLQERPEDEVARMHLNRLEAIGSESPREIVFRFDKK
jgi:adenylate cyclase